MRDERGIGGSGEYCGDNDAHLGRISVFYHEALGSKNIPRVVLFDLELIAPRPNVNFLVLKACAVVTVGAGTMHAIAPSIPPHVCHRKGRRRPTQGFYAASVAIIFALVIIYGPKYVMFASGSCLHRDLNRNV
jgi:hypothetical protein